MKQMVAQVDGTYTKSFSFRPGIFEALSVPLPSDGKLHEITLRFDGWQEIGGVNLAVLMRRMQRVSDCP